MSAPQEPEHGEGENEAQPAAPYDAVTGADDLAAAAEPLTLEELRYRCALLAEQVAAHLGRRTS